MTRLRIYSKPRGAGDQTSGGRGKLLRATSNLTRVQVLVRETLQNSWDAKLDDWIPAYGVYVHRASEDVKRTLSDEVFTSLPESLKVLEDSLTHPKMRVMEIYDRGTSGLDGPFRAGEAAAPGAPNNFNSFVFDIGTTKDERGAGGTFGFGKTATFEVSHAHSVVYWSVCEDNAGELEHRLVASALHEPYDEAGTRFTGAHWWGDVIEEDTVPLRGAAAQELGERLFETHFGEEETGTSILVIDPEVRVDSQEEAAAERVQVQTEEHEDLLIDEVVEALAYSAWPKVVGAGDEYPPMIFHVYKRGEEIEVSERVSDRYARYGSSLTAIRKKLDQLEGPVEPPQLHVLKETLEPIVLRPRRSFDEPLEEFFGNRSDSTAGFLHLMLTADDGTDRSGPVTSGLPTPKNQLCLMRSKAELVVYYDSIADTDLGGLQWTGVFKPTPECDFHFASSEPPTHDTWTPNTADTEVSAYVVRRTLEAVRRKTRDFLETERMAQSSANRSVRDVANALSNFVPLGPAVSEEEPEPDRSERPGRRRRVTAQRPQAVVTQHHPAPDGLGFMVEFEVKGEGGPEFALHAKPSARTSDGGMVLESSEFRLTWNGHERSGPGKNSAIFRSGSEGELHIATRTALALDLVIDVEEHI